MSPREPRTYYTYIMGSRFGVLYIGMTGNLAVRVLQHKEGKTSGFTARYRVKRLLHYEEFASPLRAIARETELKGWRRSRKLDLINSKNPRWRDLSRDWTENVADSQPGG
jgi:putative endonuclease